ncbi:MAG: hypothetical protein ABWJ42_04480 [Sulfolobales archaeon]
MTTYQKLDKCPRVIIDAGLIYYHRIDELKSLCKETLLGYSSLKRYCVDYQLVFVYPFRGLYDSYVERILRGERILVINTSVEHVLSVIGSSKPLYLDPYAERDLGVNDLYYYDSIVIGGIVDKPPRKRLTTLLIERNLPRVDSRRISLRGSIVGVPSEINSVIEIILRTLMYRDLERAIRETQSKRDAMVRVLVELSRARRSIKSREDVERIYRELEKWLNIDLVVFRRALHRAGIPRDLWI